MSRKRENHLISCKALGRIAAPPTIEWDGETYDLDLPKGLNSYESGIVTVDEDGNIVFTPSATPDIAYLITPDGQTHCRVIQDGDGLLKYEPKGDLRLVDLVVQEGDPDAQRVSNRIESNR